ncbi:hypothetical protein [Aeromonas enteropelogenes]|uniref:hypothetical protein n=1 Tax=Aeromonas enteropelogenes TaxID=29489 RepID=UPI003BA16569
MRSFQEVTRAINWRWITKKTLKALMYCINPLNFFKLIFRLFKWAIYIVFGAIVLSMLTLVIGNYANAAEWVPAPEGISPSGDGVCEGVSGGTFKASSVQDCLDNYHNKPWATGRITIAGPIGTIGVSSALPPYTARQSYTIYVVTTDVPPVTKATYVKYFYSGHTTGPYCPPPDKPDFKFGPKVTDKGAICEKAPIQCLTGSIKDTNVITGKEFCRPMCEGIAGNTLGDQGDLKTYIKAQFGSVEIQCYGQCSVVPVGGSINVVGQPNVWQAVIKFTGEKCPVQHNGEQQDEDVAGTVEPPKSSDATGDAQNQLQNAASSAISNTTSGATGTSTLNDVVDKLAETSNKEVKAGSEQNAALGKVIQEVGKDIQSQIKEAQLSQSQGSAGASIGQIQTANAIKDGNAKMGEKLDAIKDAIENQDKGEDKPLPPGVTAIETDAGTVYTNRNDWASRNYNTVLQQHVASLKGLPMFEAVGGFFQVNTNAGTCPQFTIDVPDIGGHGGGSLVFDAFCDADLAKIFAIIALCIKLAGMYVGFRIAILD